jgi:hypothetical protein
VEYSGSAHNRIQLGFCFLSGLSGYHAFTSTQNLATGFVVTPLSTNFGSVGVIGNIQTAMSGSSRRMQTDANSDTASVRGNCRWLRIQNPRFTQPFTPPMNESKHSTSVPVRVKTASSKYGCHLERGSPTVVQTRPPDFTHTDSAAAEFATCCRCTER